MQEESGVYANFINSPEELLKNIRKGKWNEVIKDIRSLKIRRNVLMDLYEQILLELFELTEYELAKNILKGPMVDLALNDEFKARFEILIGIATHKNFNPETFFSKKSKQEIRDTLAISVKDELEIVKPGRLLHVIHQGLLAIQKQEKSLNKTEHMKRYDIFEDRFFEFRDLNDQIPKEIAKVIRMPGNSRLETAIFSDNGQFLITGTSDGYIEVWDPYTYKHSPEIAYQLDEIFMMHDKVVTS